MDQLDLLDEHPHQRGPVAEERGQRVHLVERLELRLVEREEALPRHERPSRVVPALVVQLRQRRQELALREAVGLRDRRLVGGGQIVPPVRDRGQAIELAARLAVLRIEDPCLADRVERAAPIAAALLPEPRVLAQNDDPLRELRGELQALLVDGDEVTPVVGPLVDRAEDVDHARLVPGQLEQLLERGHGLRAGPVADHRRELHHGLQLVDPGLRLAEAPDQQLRELHAQARLVLRERALLGASARQVRQIAPALAARVEAGERLEGVLIPFVDVERGAVGLDRPCVVRELRLLQESDRMKGAEAQLGVALVLERVPIELDPVGGPARLAEQAVDGLEAPVLRLGLEGVGATVEVEGAVDVLLRLEELARALREPRSGRLVRRDLLELACIDVGQASLGVGDPRQPLELAPCPLVGRVFREEKRGRLEGGAVVLRLLFVQLREPSQEQAALVGILTHVEPGLERGHHAPPVEARQVHRLEHLGGSRRVLALPHQRLEGRHRLRVPRVDGQRRGVLVEGAVDLPGSLLEDGRERVVQRGAALVGRARRGDLPLVEGDQIRAIAPPARRGARGRRWPWRRAPSRGSARRPRWPRGCLRASRRRAAPA